ncbi:hypothetical protein GGD63_006962 [Bradyrhizobium sp. cir1]|nr:hypothetical protein [Bradyrhizobium sp. cir1]
MRMATATDIGLRQRYRELTEPHDRPPGAPAFRTRRHASVAALLEDIEIDPWMKEAFEALTPVLTVARCFALLPLLA